MTIPILDFLQYEDWYFAVMPFCGVCMFVAFGKASEVLELAEQAMSVSLI